MEEEFDALTAREQEWMSAILARDLPRLETMLAPEFTYTASNHGRRNRQEWMDAIAHYDFDDLALLDTTVAEYGQVAVVHARIRQHATLAGQARVGVFLITDVWVCRDDRWQIVSRSSIADQRP